MKIQMNMCKLDRGLRVAASLFLIYTGFVNPDMIGNTVINFLLGSFGLLNLVSALIGFCPVYHIANLSTFPKERSGQH